MHREDPSAPSLMPASTERSSSCDNGSTDRSVAIAERMGARVVHQPLRGYGNAYLKGFAEAAGTVPRHGRCRRHLRLHDDSPVPRRAARTAAISSPAAGTSAAATATSRDFTVGSAIRRSPRILNILFGTRYTDVYCGFRAFSREAYDRIRPVSPGMEFNLELAINAGLAGLRTARDPDRAGPEEGRIQAAHVPGRLAEPADDAPLFAEQAVLRSRAALLLTLGLAASPGGAAGTGPVRRPSRGRASPRCSRRSSASWDSRS